MQECSIADWTVMGGGGMQEGGRGYTYVSPFSSLFLSFFLAASSEGWSLMKQWDNTLMKIPLMIYLPHFYNHHIFFYITHKSTAEN